MTTGNWRVPAEGGRMGTGNWDDPDRPRTVARARSALVYRPGLATLALGALALGACSRDRDARAAETPAPAVMVGAENVAVVERAELRSGPAISGTLEPHWEATIRAEVAGPVLQTYVERGQAVSRGARLGRLDDVAIRDAYLSALSAVRSAQTAADVARRNAERTSKLAEAGAVAERDLESARWNVQNAEAGLADARARLAAAEQQLARTQLRAPAAGIVSERHVQAGDVVQPGTAMFTVVDPSRMKLEASVPAQQLSEARVGAPVEFTVSGYPGRTFTGRVDRVNPVADPATGQVRLYASIPNTGGTLVAGLFADGRVASQAHTGVVAPATAVDRRGIRPSVVRVRNGRVERVEVELGLEDEQNERVEVVRGLAAGDTVLVGAAQGIAPGTPVRVSVVRDSAAR
jgi:membrane fusion protein (multidrug efflux system)